MNRVKKLRVTGETIRRLGTAELHHAVGGRSGEACSFGLSGCGQCDPQPSLTNTVCNACVQTDGCTYGCTGVPCQYP
jgi:hypothetical protein